MLKRRKKKNDKYNIAAEIFRGFANPVRIEIIDALRNDSYRVKELADLLGYTQPIVSQQLRILKSAGVVQRVRIRNNYRYALASKHFGDIIDCIRGCLGI